jgi:uncharacterized membrane protein YgdD (TMEM256/DUF423 family)
MEKLFVIIGSILFCFAIILGAFGAHGLKEIISEQKLNSFEVGLRYQMFQSLAIIVLALNSKLFSFRLTNILWIMTAGVLLFSGSIYCLSLSELSGISFKFLGPVTPLGGTLLVSGWCIFIFKLIKSQPST